MVVAPNDIWVLRTAVSAAVAGLAARARRQLLLCHLGAERAADMVSFEPFTEDGSWVIIVSGRVRGTMDFIRSLEVALVATGGPASASLRVVSLLRVTTCHYVPLRVVSLTVQVVATLPNEPLT